MESRYSRQELFYGIGKTGQQLLNTKHAVIVGAGALGSSAAETLVRAGVGKITIIDRDFVEYSNLNRQQLYTEQDARVKLPKAEAAKNRLQAINTETEIISVTGEADFFVLEQALPADLFIDALDNFDTRMLINDFCQKHGLPWIYGACVGSYGITFTILPQNTPCLHCLMEDIPLDGETCDTAGIIAPAVQMVSSHQSTEALKILTENWSALRMKLLSFNLWNNESSAIDVKLLKKEDCPSCGKEASYPFLEYKNRAKTEVLCGRNAVQVRPAEQQYLALPDLKKRYSKAIQQENKHLIVLNLEGKRFVIFQDGRTIIHGENDKSRARVLYQRYIGG
ncbi:ThiF family adenylyltransferase [Alteribacillus bidgolensis]|uniref:Molybdopterin or thiamine biosynthesis adenylyltransferase n=1 Tax=Alteribacillus bidgolensis TaxID=930129 RepID=A0A1G8ILQ3_9BACI|nr:ThiF family adenylyltransferase [Alteribacillus bidgolensis]SDI19899.1 Molybdopterin or thiamine biosynthesis adenylyltransferase [Alteribacillus bidgolensis]